MDADAGMTELRYWLLRLVWGGAGAGAAAVDSLADYVVILPLFTISA